MSVTVIPSTYEGKLPICSTGIIKDNNKTIVIDPGLSKEYIKNEKKCTISRLKKHANIKDIDAFLFTHLHGDHASGVVDLIENSHGDMKFKMFAHQYEFITAFYATPFVPLFYLDEMSKTEYITKARETLSMHLNSWLEYFPEPTKGQVVYYLGKDIKDRFQERIKESLELPPRLKSGTSAFESVYDLIRYLDHRYYSKKLGKELNAQLTISKIIDVMKSKGFKKEDRLLVLGFYIAECFSYYMNFLDKNKFKEENGPAQLIELPSIVKGLEKDFAVFFTPGHAKGQLSYLYDDHLFVGDLMYNEEKDEIPIKADEINEWLVRLPPALKEITDESGVSKAEAVNAIQKLKLGLKNHKLLKKVKYIVPGHGAVYKII
jgi:glyoxylase-like metal-dependent hydrolase (beta-lactamase superfamily II)